MRQKFQNIQPKRKGLACEVQVINTQGHGILTTYEQGVDNSVVEAQTDLVEFWNECIESFERGGSGLRPLVNGLRRGATENETVDVTAPEFDLGLYTRVTIMPVPMSGG